MTTQNTYVVRMVSRDGVVGYYTGRAADGWFSRDVAEAFAYQTAEGARGRAANINRATSLHGFHAVGFRVRTAAEVRADEDYVNACEAAEFERCGIV